MGILQFLHLVFKKKGIIVCFALIFMAAAGIYEWKAQIVPPQKVYDYSYISAVVQQEEPERGMYNFVKFCKSDIVYEEFFKIHPQGKYPNIKLDFGVSIDGTSDVITFSILSGYYEEEVLRDLVDIVIDQAPQYLPIENIQILSSWVSTNNPEASVQISISKILVYCLAGLFGGAIVGACVVLVLLYMSNRVYTKEQLEEYTQLPVLDFGGNTAQLSSMLNQICLQRNIADIQYVSDNAKTFSEEYILQLNASLAETISAATKCIAYTDDIDVYELSTCTNLVILVKSSKSKASRLQRIIELSRLLNVNILVCAYVS